MANENLIRLIEQTPDIKKRFKTEYISFGKPAGKPAIQTPYQTIHNDEKYLLWKAEIEAELEKLPQSKTVQDVIHLFSKMGKNFSEDSTFAQLEAKLTVLGKTLSESVEEESGMDKPHKLFISHSSKDVDYVEAIVGLLEILGLRDEEIICSSVPPYCIPLGNICSLQAGSTQTMRRPCAVGRHERRDNRNRERASRTIPTTRRKVYDGNDPDSDGQAYDDLCGTAGLCCRRWAAVLRQLQNSQGSVLSEWQKTVWA